jgi:hypothetical protein
MCVSCLIRAASNAVQYIVFKHDGDTAPQHTQVVCVRELCLCVCSCVFVCLCLFFPSHFRRPFLGQEKGGAKQNKSEIRGYRART